RVLEAGAGLTRAEAENAFSLALVRHGRLTPEPLWQLKTASLRKSSALSLHRGGQAFQDLGGLDALKHFCRSALSPPAGVCGRGVLLLGVPGTGKTVFAKALGNECHRPVLSLDIGALMGSLVGQTEQRLREALAIADAMAPAILFIDEIEKGLSGFGSSGDSGVAGRMLGTLLSWLSDHETDVFVIATCNDIRRLPPEFSRAERFDAVFFLDLPERTEKDRIWEICRRQFGVASRPLPDDRNWTGAEIRACCRLSQLLQRSLGEAAQLVIPIAASAGGQIENLRTWADGRCLDANRPGPFHHSPNKRPSRRSIQTQPSDN
ncbi:MAG: AAA family ATPase, partial [Myxococcales bacterium]|nr:AAA family ATPase [Myxococcales bacterium]